MSVATENMIAALASARTGPAVFAGYRPRFQKVTPSQWVTWKLGDTSDAGTTFRVVGERLCEALQLQTGERVLNVTAGNSNTTLAAAESLPFRDSAFDVVISGFGAMISTIARYSANRSEQSDPVHWGTREYLNDLFGHSADALGAATKTHTWRYRSVKDWLKTWRSYGGPLHDVYRTVDPDWRDQLSAELLALVDRFNEATDWSVVIQSEYLEFLVHKSSWQSC